MKLGWLRKASPDSDPERLHAAIVAASRAQDLYIRCGVADTPEGRFESLALHLALVVRRLRSFGPEGEGLAQAVVDRAFTELDSALRQLGVGDLSVPRKIKAMAANYLGRASSYESALMRGDGALEEALVRNILDGDGRGDAGIALTRYVRVLVAGLDSLGLSDIAAGHISGPT